MKSVRMWFTVQFPVAPFTTEFTIESEVQSRNEFVMLLIEEIEKIRDDAERIEVRCISWEQGI